jgi:hypothetical protein
MRPTTAEIISVSVRTCGNQTVPVSSLTTDPNHFFAKYHFHVQPGMPGKDEPFSSEITGGYNGSSNDEKAIGVTIGVSPVPFGRTEDHAGNPPYFKPLCNDGQCGGVSKVPNLGSDFTLTWAADKMMNGDVVYRGYAMTMDGKQYLIAMLTNPPKDGNRTSGSHSGTGGGGTIDFTTPGQNTYIRGRNNNAGNTAPTGLLGNGHFIQVEKS